MASLTAQQVDPLPGLSTRILRPADIESVQKLYAALDEHDGYFRFFGCLPKNLRPLASLTCADDTEHAAIGAFIGDQLVGVANYVRLNQSPDAEIAMAVAHGVQLHGVGTRLLAELSELAITRGLVRLEGQVLAENARMLRVLRECGRPVTFHHREHATVCFNLDLSPDRLLNA